MGLFSSTGLPHKRCALIWTAAGGRGEGVEWRGRSGGEGREGEGRGWQGRVPDCLGGLSRVGISSRSTRPWNGQPPSNVRTFRFLMHVSVLPPDGAAACQQISYIGSLISRRRCCFGDKLRCACSLLTI